MKAMAPLLAVAGLLMASGCATTRDASTPEARNGIDYEKIYLVENWAKRNNANVVWINYPTRRGNFDPASPTDQ